MIKALSFVFITFIIYSVQGQNLVHNPGFEQNMGCPTYVSQINYATFWGIPGGHGGSPDYFHTCGTGGAGAPANMLGYEWPASGNAYGGMHCWALTSNGVSLNSHEYLQTILSAPLQAGYVYHVSLKYSYENATVPSSTTILTDALGIYLASSVPPAPNPYGNFPLAAQYQPLQQVASTGWTEMEFYYTATGGEQYLVLGNFKDDLDVTVSPPPPQLPSGIAQSYYFYVDDISVERFPNLLLSGNTLICAGESSTLTAANSNTYAWAEAGAPNTILSTGSTITVSPGATTTYMVYGDSDTASITVTVKPTPIVNLGPDTVVCQGDNLLLIAYQGGAHIAGTQYLWHNGNTTPFFTPTQSGTYWVSATLNGCSTSDTIQVILNPVPGVDLGNALSLCEGQSLLLNATTPNATYLWQDNSTAPTYTVTQGGTYSVTVSIGNCTATDSVTVTENPLPIVNLGDDTALCQNQDLLLDATQPNAGYQWQNNSTNATFLVSQGGTYWVNVTVAGCSTRDSIQVLGLPIPSVDLGPDTSICVGNTLMLDVSQPGLSYHWQNDSQAPTYTVTHSGTYTVQVTDANLCQNTDAITVTYITAPGFEFEDSLLCRGDKWILDITSAAAMYLWQDKSTQPTYTIYDAGTYWGMASNACGSASDTVTVEYRHCDCYLHIPNSFTPNDDYRNEKFLLLHNTECKLEAYTLSIFNRWGQLIFETGNIEFLWDGMMNNKHVPADVYTYRVAYKFDKGPQTYRWGQISVMR